MWDNVLAKAVWEGECLLYRGPNFHGYGQITEGTVHRIAWARVNGPIPYKMDIHHTCERKNCINDEHLECLTKKEHRARHPKHGTRHRPSVGLKFTAFMKMLRNEIEDIKNA